MFSLNDQNKRRYSYDVKHAPIHTFAGQGAGRVRLSWVPKGVAGKHCVIVASMDAKDAVTSVVSCAN